MFSPFHSTCLYCWIMISACFFCRLLLYLLVTLMSLSRLFLCIQPHWVVRWGCFSAPVYSPSQSCWRLYWCSPSTDSSDASPGCTVSAETQAHFQEAVYWRIEIQFCYCSLFKTKGSSRFQNKFYIPMNQTFL